MCRSCSPGFQRNVCARPAAKNVILPRSAGLFFKTRLHLDLWCAPAARECVPLILLPRRARYDSSCRPSFCRPVRRSMTPLFASSLLSLLCGGASCSRQRKKYVPHRRRHASFASTLLRAMRGSAEEGSGDGRTCNRRVFTGTSVCC